MPEVAHQGTGQSVVVQPDNIFPWYVYVSRQVHPLWVLVEHVFVRSGTTWTQQQKLVANDGMTYDEFGISVALYGNTLVVGARLNDGNSISSGSAYVFVRSGTTWTRQQKLVANDGAKHHYFGSSVALDGDTLVVASPRDDDNGEWSGSAYVFVRSGTTWTRQQKLVANDGTEQQYFGSSVAISGRKVYGVNSGIISVGSDCTLCSVYTAFPEIFPGVEIERSEGSVYTYVYAGTSYSFYEKLVANDRMDHDKFGGCVAIDGDTILVGATMDDDKGDASGSAYVFKISQTSGPPPPPSLLLSPLPPSLGVPPSSGNPSSSGTPLSSGLSALNGLLGLIFASMVAFVLV